MIADNNDPDNVGFVQWRVAFYVAGEDGCVLNFLSLFDDYLAWKASFECEASRQTKKTFIAWKAKTMAKDIEAHIFAHMGVNELSQEKIETEFNYEHYTVHEPLPEDELPLKWSEAAPCTGKRIATLHLTASSDTHLKLIWSGALHSSVIVCACMGTSIRARPFAYTSRMETILGNTWAFRDKMDEANIKGTAVILLCCVVTLVCSLDCSRGPGQEGER